jgi:DNA-binding transcriptional ArsR family regulator
MTREYFMNCCSKKPKLEDRPLLSVEQAGELEALFKVLGNMTRLRMLQTVAAAREICVTDLADKLSMKPQAISNQLQRLVDRGMLGHRRNGNNIFYRIVDPCVVSLLDTGLCLMEDAKERRTFARTAYQDEGIISDRQFSVEQESYEIQPLTEHMTKET